jgi:sugar lactone lactonase YvrE
MGTAASFNSPYGVAVDSSGNVYVADTNNQRIRKITPNGTVMTLAGAGDFGYADGIGTAASFGSPQGVAVDSSGNVYVADKDNSRIRKITPNGTVTTLAGGNEGYADGIGTAASFYSPSGVAVDSSGNVYVADSYNHRIRKILGPQQ